MQRLLFSCTVVLTLALLAGCAGSASSGRTSNTYRTTLGSFDQGNIIALADDVLLTRYGFRFERTVNTSEDIYLETDWKDQTAFDDEKAEGFAFARTRVIVTARPRNRTPGIANTYAVTFRAENQVRAVDSIVWEDAPMSPERLAFIKEISDYYKRELQTSDRSL